MGRDIRQPLGIAAEVDAAATSACLSMFKTVSFPVGTKSESRDYTSSRPTSAGRTVRDPRCRARPVVAPGHDQPHGRVGRPVG